MRRGAAQTKQVAKPIVIGVRGEKTERPIMRVFKQIYAQVAVLDVAGVGAFASAAKVKCKAITRKAKLS